MQASADIGMCTYTYKNSYSSVVLFDEVFGHSDEVVLGFLPDKKVSLLILSFSLECLFFIVQFLQYYLRYVSQRLRLSLHYCATLPALCAIYLKLLYFSLLNFFF